MNEPITNPQPTDRPSSTPLTIGSEEYCQRFRFDNCPTECQVGPSCPICQDEGCHAKGAHRVQLTPIFCQTNADCPPVIGVCVPGNCPTWRCIDGRCIYFQDAKDRVALCKSAGGTWRKFPTTCVDSCEFVRKTKKGLDVFCGEAITDSCDCDPDRCWTGTTCEPN